MPLHIVDLTDYLEMRRRMRLLPNLLDFGIVYGVFRPVGGLYQASKPLARLEDSSVGLLLYTKITSDPFGFVVWVCGYALYAIAAATFNGVVGVKIKTLVLSDSRITIWIIGSSFALLSLIWIVMLPSSGKAVAAVAAIPAFASAKYLIFLNRLSSHPIYRHLVAVPRRTFAYSTSRYALLSRESLMVYARTLGSAWRLYVGYVGVGLIVATLIIGVQTGAGRGLEGWFDRLPGLWQVVVGVVAFLLVSQVIAYGRKLVASEWNKWTRQLRAELARSAASLSRFDQRSPILFLRSFQDDTILVASERSWGQKFFGVGTDAMRLEEVLAETLYAYGPLVTLSNPRDKLPRLGAARDNIEEENWQHVVEKHMHQASKIVLLVGTTPNLRWEVDQIIAHGFLSKVLVVFPPAYRDNAASARLLREYLPNLAKALDFSPDAREIAHLGGAVVMARGAEDGWVVVRHEGAGEARGYADAVRLAMLSGQDRSMSDAD